MRTDEKKQLNGISVVICCYNSEKRLPKVLEHLQNQTGGNGIDWELIVVDNASKDRTSQVAKDLWRRDDVEMRVIFESRPGLSNARLAGFASARYDIISFIDDDNWVEEQWIMKVYERMNSDHNIAILGGKGEAVFESEPPFWFDKYQSAYAVGPYGKVTGKQEKKLINGAGMNIRRSAWEYMRSNGFEFILSGRTGKALSSGEDAELCLAFRLAGFDLFYEDKLSFFHYMPEGRLHWKYLVNLYKAFGRASPVLHLYYALLHENGWNQINKINTLLTTTRSFYHFFRFLPKLLPLAFKKSEGEKRILRFVYVYSTLLEKLRLFFVFPQYVRKIKESNWYRESHERDHRLKSE